LQNNSSRKADGKVGKRAGRRAGKKAGGRALSSVKFKTVRNC
jgi:hypothetical protein